VILGGGKGPPGGKGKGNVLGKKKVSARGRGGNGKRRKRERNCKENCISHPSCIHQKGRQKRWREKPRGNSPFTSSTWGAKTHQRRGQFEKGSLEI